MRITLDLDDETNAILTRALAGRKRAAWLRAAIVEKATRDEFRARLEAVEAEQARIRAHFGIPDPD